MGCGVGDPLHPVPTSRAHLRSAATQARSRVPGLAVTDDEADTVFQGYLRRYESGWTVFDDAVPALRRVRHAGLKVVVLTNGNEGHQRLKLERLALTDEIDVPISSETLPAGKPDPRAFLCAAERLALGPGELLMVGNSLEKDVRGALMVGMDAVLLTGTTLTLASKCAA